MESSGPGNAVQSLSVQSKQSHAVHVDGQYIVDTIRLARLVVRVERSRLTRRGVWLCCAKIVCAVWRLVGGDARVKKGNDSKGSGQKGKLESIRGMPKTKNR